MNARGAASNSLCDGAGLDKTALWPGLHASKPTGIYRAKRKSAVELRAELACQRSASHELAAPDRSGACRSSLLWCSGACWGAGGLQAELLPQGRRSLSEGQLRPIRSNEAKVPNPQGLDWAIEARACDRSHNGLRETTGRGIDWPLKRGRDVPPHSGAGQLHLSWPRAFSPQCQDQAEAGT